MLIMLSSQVNEDVKSLMQQYMGGEKTIVAKIGIIGSNVKAV